MSRQVTGTDTATSHPVSYDSGYQAYSVSTLDNAYASSSNTSYAQLNLTRNNGAVTQIYYNFSFNIPSGATITAISANEKCYINTTNSSRITTRQIQLYANGSAKGTATTISNNQNVTSMTPGSVSNWSVSDVNNLKIRVYVVRGSSNTTSNYYVRFYGADVTVTYSYNYTLYTVTSSSTVSGVTITPASEEYAGGTDATLKIDGDITGATVTDNNTDVTSSLVYHQYTNPTYSVGSVSGASYGFALSNGWYESQNKGVNNSAALCRVTIDSVVQCRVTFTYINYAEATYDFGIFSKADTALTLDYPVSSSSGGDTTIDNGLYEKRCNSSSDNSSSQQTLQYTLSAGEHFIDVKFGKDAATASNNDSLRFQVEVTPLETIPTGGYYIYKIAQIDADHTVLVSGGTTGDKIYIKLGEPEDTQIYYKYFSDADGGRYTADLSAFSNGDTCKVMGELRGYVGSVATINDTFTWSNSNQRTYYVNGSSAYYYTLTFDSSGYNISWQTQSSSALYGSLTIYKVSGAGGWTLAKDIYVKVSGAWKKVTKTLKKTNGAWVEQDDKSAMFDPNAIYINGQ